MGQAFSGLETFARSPLEKKASAFEPRLQARLRRPRRCSARDNQACAEEKSRHPPREALLDGEDRCQSAEGDEGQPQEEAARRRVRDAFFHRGQDLGFSGHSLVEVRLARAAASASRRRMLVAQRRAAALAKAIGQCPTVGAVLALPLPPVGHLLQGSAPRARPVAAARPS